MRILPARRLRGRVRVPGDKSISHRAAILAALAGGRTRISNFSTSADCAATLACLERLGTGIEREASTVFIEGAGRAPGRWAFREPSGPLDCGNSGTTMRLLAGLLAAQPFASRLTGDESLRRRPMRRVVEPLELMGACIEDEAGHAPLRIEGRSPLTAIEYRTPVASAQVKSCILLAGLGAEGTTRVSESVQTRDHTERMLRWFGVDVGPRVKTYEKGRRSFILELKGPAELGARDVKVPGDLSAAAFLLAAALLVRGSELSVEGVGLNATRSGVLEVLRGFGSGLHVSGVRELCNEPVGDICVRGSERAGMSFHSKVIGGDAVAGLIDELPLLAVVATQAEGGLEIRDAGELRLKESDRIRAVAENLRAMGAEVEEYEDGMRVGGPLRLRGARLRCFGDHRIAMAFAVAGLIADGETEIEGAEECVPISFPEFFGLLEALAER